MAIVIITILANVLCMCIFKNKSVYIRGDIHQLAEENEGGSEVPYENMSDNYPVRFIINDASREEVYEDPTNMIFIPREDSKEEYINVKPGNINMTKNSAYTSVADHQEL